MRKTISFIFLIVFIFMFPKYTFAESIEVKVLNVNLEYNFIILDIGKENNIFEGLKFKVFKNGQLLGVANVIKAKQEVSAFNVESFIKGMPIAPKDTLVLKGIGTASKMTFRKRAEELKPEKKPKKEEITITTAPYKELEKDYSDIRIFKEKEKEEITPQEEKGLAIFKPFRKIKQWTVGAGKEIKSWFTEEKEKEPVGVEQIEDMELDTVGIDREIKSRVPYIQKEREREEIRLGKATKHKILDIPSMVSVKLETEIKGSRRKILFLINEELKNRGFIVTNYSLIEGIINAQKPLQLSVFKEMFANMKSAIDYKVIYAVDVKQVNKEFARVDLDISASYKKGGKYRRLKLGRSSGPVREARDMLISVKQKIR